MSDISKKNLTEIVSLIKKKEIKSEEVTNSFIKNINNDIKLNSFITNCSELALEKAKNFDKNPNLETLLPGIPIAIKDLFCTEGVKTTAGSKMLENFIPNYESTITKNLWNEGAFLLGKLNCDEYAMGSSNETSYFGNVMNPIAENTVPGGSSGGSASALTADLTPTTIGTPGKRVSNLEFLSKFLAFSKACSLQFVIKEFNFLSFLILSINEAVTSSDLISFFLIKLTISVKLFFAISDITQ